MVSKSKNSNENVYKISIYWNIDFERIICNLLLFMTKMHVFYVNITVFGQLGSLFDLWFLSMDHSITHLVSLHVSFYQSFGFSPYIILSLICFLLYQCITNLVSLHISFCHSFAFSCIGASLIWFLSMYQCITHLVSPHVILYL